MLNQGYNVTVQHEESHWWFLSRRELILKQVKRAVEEIQSSNPSILDYGCGSGFNLPLLSEHGTVSCADVTDEYLIESGNYPFYNISNGFGDSRFDLITMFDVLEHVEDDVGQLQKLGKILNPTGQILITVPAYNWLCGDEDRISNHIRRYTSKRLKHCVKTAGFEIEFISYMFASILPLAAASILWQRLFTKRGKYNSSLDASPKGVNGILKAITGFELRMIGDQKTRLPAGASIACRARRRS